MRIGLVSDTHGNVGALGRALELFAQAQTDRVFFLGGGCADLDAALARRRRAPAGARVPTTDLEFLGAVRGALSREAGLGGDPLTGRVVKIASRDCPEYASGALPRKHLDMAEGFICCLVHDTAELNREDIANATLLFHGNSERAQLLQIGPRCFVTPGHLRDHAPEGSPPGFALLDVEPGGVELIAYSADGAEQWRDQAAFGVRGKVTVR